MKDLTTIANISESSLSIKELPGGTFLLSVVDGTMDRGLKFHGTSLSLVCTLKQLREIYDFVESQMGVLV